MGRAAAGSRKTGLNMDDPAGIRTQNQTIKSRLLCQLSYGAARGIIPQREGVSMKSGADETRKTRSGSQDSFLHG